MSSDSDDSYICFKKCDEDNETSSETDISSSESHTSSSFEENDTSSTCSDSDEENAASNSHDKSSQKKVRFKLKPVVHLMITWSFAYRRARMGNWEEKARDNERFKRRIRNSADFIDPVLSLEHRVKIFESRFAN